MAVDGTSLKISLGPLLYHWPRQAVFDFYERAAVCAAHIIYVGETVCAKRRELAPEDWLAVADTLASAGKEVVLSTLALIEAESDLSSVRRWCGSEGYLVEANDMGAIQILAERGRSFVIGPTINAYNGRTLRALRACGLRRWVAPVEMSGAALRDALGELHGQQPDCQIETEVFAYGRLPLAYSARCFTARACNLPKDQCEFRCLRWPGGIALSTRDDRDLFRLNGIQVLSGQVQNLCGQWQAIAGAGANILRVSPEGPETLAVVDELACAVREQRRPLLPGDEGAVCSGYWTGAAGMLWQTPAGS